MIDEIRQHLHDTSYELAALMAKEATRIHIINEQRRHAATHRSEQWQMEHIHPDYYPSMKNFILVLNMHYENRLRESYLRSVQAF